MKLKNIVMLEPKAPARHVFSLVRIPRMGMPILGTLAQRRGISTSVVIEETAPVKMDEVKKSDLLCISTITPTAPHAYELADQARAAGVQVIIGGPHATFLPDEALEHADWVMRGEGENSFDMFLDMLEKDDDPALIPGLCYRLDGQVTHNDIQAKPVDMDSVPIPDFSLLLGRNKRYDFDMGIIPIQTSRGCPHNCNFCSVTPMFGHRVRYAGNEHVAEELNLRRGHGTTVFFYDDNFCASSKRTKSLLDYLLTKNVFLPPWMAQVSVRAAQDAEMVKLMRRAGCYRVFIGLESIDAKSLAQYNKHQTIEDIRFAVRRFHQSKIQVHGMFMFGSDADEVETIQTSSRFVLKEGIDTVQFMVLTPLPGTPVYSQMRREARLLTEDWSLYDAHHTVFRPKRISAHDLTVQTIEGMAKVYSAKRIISMAVKGNFNKAILNYYARKQVRLWKKENSVLFENNAKGQIEVGSLTTDRSYP